MLPDRALAVRMLAAERQCHIDWVQAIADLPGNPYRAAVRTFGESTATICGVIPAEVLNRIYGCTEHDRELIGAIDQAYRDYGANPVFDLNPYSIRPFWEKPGLLRSLAEMGFYQAWCHQILYLDLSIAPVAAASELPASHPTAGTANVGTDVVVRIVDGREAAAFGALYRDVWGDPGVALVWLEHPRFTCYIASVGGEDAGLGVLHVADGVASLANALTIPRLRNRGAQTALIHRRIEDARAAGCDLLVSQCGAGTSSQHNQMQAGLLLAGTNVWWMRLA